FREIKSNETYEKEVNHFCMLSTWLHCCAVVTRADGGPSSTSAADGKRPDLHSLTLYNSIGTLIDRHLVSLKVRHCCLNSSRMVVASEDSFYVWTFNQPYTIGGNLKSESLARL